ncbi:MAG: hypothetical protein IJY09_10690 [Lachnospiraceae bacterium]|nr:hypothetical protein [Lachnospiraceae bacterium]
MNERTPLDMVKEIAWNLLVYVLYYIYSFVVLMIFHFCAFRVLKLEWTVPDIVKYALVAATVAMVVRIARLIFRKK